MSERTVGKTFDNIFAEHKNTRIIIATFASNVDRVQQIINSAYKYGRKVCGRGPQYGQCHQHSGRAWLSEHAGEYPDRYWIR